MTTGIINTATPVEHALCSTEERLAELITTLRDGGMDHYDEAGKAAVLDRVQKLLSMIQAADAEVIAACRDGGVPEKECQRSMTKVLERRCLIGPGEATRRAKAAEAIGPQMSPTGLPLPRLRPRIAEAMSSGAVNADQVRVVREGLDKLDTAGIDPDTVDTVEAELVDHCARFGPKELSRICQSYRDTLDPDGPEPDEERNHDQRNVELRPMASGAYKLDGRLTGELGAKLAAILSPLAKPCIPKTDDLDSAGSVSAVDLLDQRTHGQRMHDALDEAVSRLLRSGDLPDSGGTPASVIITTDINDLLAHTQHTRHSFRASEWVCTYCGATNHEPAADHHDQTPPPDAADDQAVRTGDCPESTSAADDDQAAQTGDDPESTSPANNDQASGNRPDPTEGDSVGKDRSGLNDDRQKHRNRPGPVNGDNHDHQRSPGPINSDTHDHPDPSDPINDNLINDHDVPTDPINNSPIDNSPIDIEDRPGPINDIHDHANPSGLINGDVHNHASPSGLINDSPINDREVQTDPIDDHEDHLGPITTAQRSPSRLHPPGRVRRKRPGHGTTSFGATLTIPELLRIANEADIYPVVMTQHGQLLDMGRSRRIATKTQTMALIARDGGCSFPGCDHPPEWCQRHHIISWLENGMTGVDNLTLLCTFHHHQFLLRGWTVKINNDGLPEWTPPRWIDPEQKPMINNRIIARIHQAALIVT